MTNGASSASGEFFPAYREFSPEHLEQGDLLAKTDAIQSIIKIVHPYYLKSAYTHFIVLTQSCDLVRRKREACKARYITLAAVRPLNLVIQREIENYQDEFDKAGMVCSKKYRLELTQFLQRLHNYSEPEFFICILRQTWASLNPTVLFLGCLFRSNHLCIMKHASRHASSH